MNKYKEILFLKNLKGVGKSRIYNKYWHILLECNDVEELAEEILKVNDKLTSDEVIDAMKKAEVTASQVSEMKDVTVITVFDPEYPATLNVMKDKRPLLLYVKGNVEALSMENIAIIGTRHPSGWSELVEEKLTQKILSVSDRAIVSGLAIGCDRIAHEGAVNANKTTVAVLPSGVNVITPPSHKALAERILETGGCLVSEYEPDTAANRGTFLERDAVVAAFADITFVIECGVKSGTMTTVSAAYEYQRRIGCYYTEQAHKGDYSGNEFMIRNKGAVRVDDTDALLQLLNEKTDCEGAEPQEKEAEMHQMTMMEYLQKGLGS